MEKPGPAEHDVMKMADDEIGAVEVEVRRQRPDDETGQPADGKEKDERQGEKERGVDWRWTPCKGWTPS